jgi:hypothetical protein
MASGGVVLPSASGNQGTSNANQTEQVSGAGAGKRKIALGVLSVLVGAYFGVAALFL